MSKSFMASLFLRWTYMSRAGTAASVVLNLVTHLVHEVAELNLPRAPQQHLLQEHTVMEDLLCGLPSFYWLRKDHCPVSTQTMKFQVFLLQDVAPLQRCFACNFNVWKNSSNIWRIDSFMLFLLSVRDGCSNLQGSVTWLRACMVAPLQRAGSAPKICMRVV